MDPIKRIIRKPVSTVVWVAVMALAALLVGVGASIMHSALTMREEIDSKQTTIAVHQLKVEKEGTTYSFMPYKGLLFEENIEYLRSLPEVKDIDFRYLSGAYIEGVNTKLGLLDFYGMKEDAGMGVNAGSDNVMLIGRVINAFTLDFGSSMRYDLSAFGLSDDVGERYNCAIFRVEEAIVLHPDYPLFARYDGDEYYDGRVTLMYQTFGDDIEPFFEKGKRYAVRGSYDPLPMGKGDWPMDQPLLPNVTLVYSESPYSAFIEGDSLVCYHDLQQDETDPFVWIDPDDPPSSTKFVSRGEGVPAVTRWDGSAEELLNDPAWRDLAEKYKMALNSFPVLGTNCLESMYSFMQNEAAIVEGRSFTDEEYAKGAKVMIMDAGVAESADLSVGDTVMLTQFQPAIGSDEGNYSIHSDWDSLDQGYNNPTLGSNVFFHGLPTGEAEEFTIVGLYRIENEWKDALCSFTPNTVFMPRKAQTELAFGGPSREIGKKEFTGFLPNGEAFTASEPVIDSGGVNGLYMSVILKNGTIDAFMKRLEDDSEFIERDDGTRTCISGLGDHVFLTFDQGWEAAKASIEGMIGSAKKLLIMTCAGAALLFAMFILICQSAERKTVGIMRSLGAPPKKARTYLFVSGLIIAAIGMIIGTELSAAFAGALAGKLGSAVFGENAALLVETMGSGSAPVWLFAILAAAGIALVAAALYIHSTILSKINPRKLMK